jgi:hypothetical protein
MEYNQTCDYKIVRGQMIDSLATSFIHYHIHFEIFLTKRKRLQKTHFPNFPSECCSIATIGKWTLIVKVFYFVRVKCK